MKREYAVGSLSNAALMQRLSEVTSRDNTTTVEMLVLLAEVDRRRLHRSEGYPSLFRYCVGVLHMSGDMAYKRIQVARAARRFPRILDLIADGRLHLTGARLIVPHLTPGNADDLLAAAVHRTTLEIQTLLAERFPQADLPTRLQPMATWGAATAMMAVRVASAVPPTDGRFAMRADVATNISPGSEAASTAELVLRPVAPSNPPEQGHSTVPLPAHTTLTPLAPARFGLQCTLSRDAHELLRYAQALLGHAVPDGDVPDVLERALRALVEQLERRQFGVGARLRAVHSPKDPRYIAPMVRREVFARDGGRCTFVGDGGHRCESRARLQFHHVKPFGKGGDSTAANLTLHCGPHNREQAKRDYGEAATREALDRDERPLHLHAERDLAGGMRASALPADVLERGRLSAAAASRELDRLMAETAARPAG